MPTQRPRTSISGRWVSTNTPVGSGATSSSIIFICSPERFPSRATVRSRSPVSRSAGGTAREVGTFTSVARRHAGSQQESSGRGGEDLEACPKARFRRSRATTRCGEPHARDGKHNAYSVQVNNNLQAAANANEEGHPGYRNPENFIVVLRRLSDRDSAGCGTRPPTAMWVEKEGAYGNAERRTHFWHQLVNAPGDARSDLWQLMEFSKRFQSRKLACRMIAKKPEYKGKTLFDVAVQERRGRQVSAVRHGAGL